MNNEIVKNILYYCDIAQLLKIKNQCEMYITYTIDNKQLLKKHEIKTNQKDFMLLLEMVESALVFKRFEKVESAASNSENIKSGLNEQPAKKTKKKGDKAEC